MGYLAPAEGLVYRPLDRPIEFDARELANEEVAKYALGIAGVEAVAGSLVLDALDWNTDPEAPPYRVFELHVAHHEDAMPTLPAVGDHCRGDLSPEWSTAWFNHNGQVTTSFVSRADGEGAFLVRHFVTSTGGSIVDPALSSLSVRVRVDGVFTTP